MALNMFKEKALSRMPSIIATGSKLSHNSLSWLKVDVPKIGSAELLFQVKPHILSLESLCSENRPRKRRKKATSGLKHSSA